MKKLCMKEKFSAALVQHAEAARVELDSQSLREKIGTAINDYLQKAAGSISNKGTVSDAIKCKSIALEVETKNHMKDFKTELSTLCESLQKEYPDLKQILPWKDYDNKIVLFLFKKPGFSHRGRATRRPDDGE